MTTGGVFGPGGNGFGRPGGGEFGLGATFQSGPMPLFGPADTGRVSNMGRLPLGVDGGVLGLDSSGPLGVRSFKIARELFERAGLGDLFSMLAREHREVLPLLSVMDGPSGPIIQGPQSVLTKLFPGETCFSLEERLRGMGVSDPKLLGHATTVRLYASAANFRISGEQLAALLRTRQVSDVLLQLLRDRMPGRGKPGEQGPPREVVEELFGDKGLSLSDPQVQAELEPLLGITANTRIEERLIPFDPAAQGFNAANNVYLSQLAYLVYPWNGRNDAEIERIAAVLGLIQPKVIQVGNSQALVGFHPGQGDGSGALVVVPRGSEEVRDWIDDFKLLRRKVEGVESGKIHTGFWKHWGVLAPAVDAYYRQNVQGVMQEHHLDPSKMTSVLAGHSLGGAAAIVAWLCSTQIQSRRNHDPNAREAFVDLPVSQVYTFGQPRVMSAPLGQWLDNQRKEDGTTYVALVNNRDLVAFMPPPPFYSHFGDECRLFYGADKQLMELGQKPKQTSLEQPVRRLMDHLPWLYLGNARLHQMGIE